MKIEIKAEPRSVQGTGASRRLRRESKVPGVLYGAGKDALAIQVDHKDLWFKLKTEAFHASILDMEIGSDKSQVLLRDYQMHPFKPLILHADFQRVAADKKITLTECQQITKQMEPTATQSRRWRRAARPYRRRSNGRIPPGLPAP